MKELFYKLNIEILRRMRILQEKINIKLRIDNEDLSGALEDFKVLFKYKESLSGYITESSNVYEGINKNIIDSFVSYAEKFKSLASNSTDRQVNLAEKAFMNILIFYRFSYTFDGKEQILLSEKTLEKGKKAFEEVQKCFVKNVNSFRSATTELNLIKLTKTLEKSQKWDKILQGIKKICLSFDFMHGFDTISNFENISKEFEEKVIDFSNSIKNQELMTENTIKFERDRKDLYKNLMLSISKLKEINKKFKDFLGTQIDLDELEIETLSVLSKKIENIKTSLNQEAIKETLSQADCDKFRVYYQHLEMFSKCISSSVIDVKETLEFAENKIFEKVDKITKEIMQNLKNPRSVAEKIVEAAFFADNIYIFQKNLKKKIKKVLNNYKGEAGQAGISALCMQLEIFPNGPRIISEYSVLAGED